jgi:P4 family phage/plasmid primase-like protien
MPKETTSPLYEFLKLFRVTGGGKYTHTSLGHIQAGSYNIPETSMEEFFQVYNQSVWVMKQPAYLTEGIRDCEFTPFRADLDFRYYTTEEEPQRLYTNEDIDKICMLYLKEMEEWLVEFDDDERIFFVMEKTKPSFDYNSDKSKGPKTNEKGEKRVKDGVHIMAPFIVTNTFLQLKFREYAYKNCSEILDKHKFDNNYSDIFDLSIIERNNWIMYGSQKQDGEPYLVTRVLRVYKDHIEEMPNTWTSQQLVELLSVRNKTSSSVIKLSKEKEVLFHQSNALEKKKAQQIKSVSKTKKRKVKADKRDIELAINYVTCLSDERAKSYQSWMEVGWALHNIHNHDDTLLNKWIEFSQRIEQYKSTAETDCKERWERMSDEGLGMGSLKLWAKQDNPEKYSEIVESDICGLIILACKSGKGPSFDVAKVLYEMYKEYYVCVSPNKNIWYYYNQNKNKWCLDEKGVSLRQMISTELFAEFKRQLKKFNDNSTMAGDTDSDRAANIMKVMAKLKETAYKNNIMTECCELFYDKDQDFITKLDTKLNLIGFKNGVYDLEKEEFRKGRPEDLISLSTNIDYIPYEPESYEINSIQNFLREILPIKKVREYIIDRMASSLSGSTGDETFDIWAGGGGNGKSKIVDLFESCYGDYCAKIPIQVLTQKRSASGAATPEIARTMGKRFITIQEPDAETKLNVGLMKELTGGDKVQARLLHQNPIEFTPQFKSALLCNNPPKMPNNETQKDAGTWRRIKMTMFPCSFVPVPKSINPYEFRRNSKLKEEFPNWKEAFMAFLIERHKDYKKNGLKFPDEIHEYTNQYKEKNDHFKEFVDDKIDVDINKYTRYVSIEEVFNVYKIWFKDTNDNSHGIKKRKELKDYMDEHFGAYWEPGHNKMGYKGIDFKSNDKKPKNMFDDAVVSDIGYEDALNA